MSKPSWKVLKGFIVTPIILSVIFSFSLSFSVFFFDSDHSKAGLFFVGIMGWFIHALPVAVLTTIIIGVPGHLLMLKLGYTSLQQYALSGIAVGAILPLPLISLTSAQEWWLDPSTSIFGGIASCVFWRVSIKR